MIQVLAGFNIQLMQEKIPSGAENDVVEGLDIFWERANAVNTLDYLCSFGLALKILNYHFLRNYIPGLTASSRKRAAA